jgi:hypothetical protein
MAGMMSQQPTTLDTRWADEETLRAVRPEVRALLESSEGFTRLSPDEKQRLAGTMVKVAAYMANPDGIVKEELAKSSRGAPAATQSDLAGRYDSIRLARPEPVLERAQDAVDDTKARLSKDPGFAGKDFKGGAITQGTQQFGELVKKVDFPKFVSGLIQNVFQAIVDSSIQQMRAYGDLLANVAKTVDQFAQDNITLNNARDWAVQKFPDKLGIDTSDMDSGFDATTPNPPPSPKLVVTADDQEGALAAISAELKLDKPITDISDANEELRLTQAAQLQIARSRQQLLASMVVLGINRIVVTDGLIHAKVIFDMQASDQAKRVAKASMYDSQTSSFQQSAGAAGWGLGGVAGAEESSSSDHITTVQSSVDDTSESKAAVKANLTGEVRVNFKSDYFPMEKLASPQMIGAIQGNAIPADKPAGTPAAAGAPAAAAAPAKM